MIYSSTASGLAHFPNVLRILLLSLISLLLAGCGSTKVYTADKTLVFRGYLYNLSEVRQMGSKLTAELPTGDSMDPGKLDSKAIKSLLKEYDSFTLTSVILLDEKEVVYERVLVDSYSDYTEHTKRLDSARKKVAKFMSDAKATQLKLD